MDQGRAFFRPAMSAAFRSAGGAGTESMSTHTLTAAKEAKKEDYLSEETKAASEAENERLRATSRATLEETIAWNQEKIEKNVDHCRHGNRDQRYA